MTVPAPSSEPARRGRRRRADGADSRARILSAASAAFARDGYDAVSLRAIAREAGVDSALVHHYFADKTELFIETVRMPARPDRIVEAVLAGPRELMGETLVRAIVTNFEDPRVRDRAIAVLRAALGHEFAARMLRQFFAREVMGRIAARLEVDDGELRADLVATQVVGLLVVRYGIRMEPLASASTDEVVARVGPVVQAYLTGAAGS